MAFKVTRQQIKLLVDYVKSVEDLMESLAMSDDTSHFISSDIEDEHFQVRYVVDDLEKEANGEGL